MTKYPKQNLENTPRNPRPGAEKLQKINAMSSSPDLCLGEAGAHLGSMQSMVRKQMDRTMSPVETKNQIYRDIFWNQPSK